MTVKVIPLQSLQGLKFDMVLPDGYIVTITMSDYEVRHYRGSVSDVIEAKIKDWMDQNDYIVENIQIIFY